MWFSTLNYVSSRPGQNRSQTYQTFFTVSESTEWKPTWNTCNKRIAYNTETETEKEDSFETHKKLYLFTVWALIHLILCALYSGWNCDERTRRHLHWCVKVKNVSWETLGESRFLRTELKRFHFSRAPSAQRPDSASLKRIVVTKAAMSGSGVRGLPWLRLPTASRDTQGP